MDISRISRRRFVTFSGTALAGSLIVGSQARGASVPWYERMRRCAQLNFSERDPLDCDVQSWVDYWTSIKADTIILNAGGMVAFYPTKVPLHHKTKFLGDRDLFGEFVQAVKKKGMRVLPRVETKSTYGEVVKARPDWFERSATGSFVPRDEFAVEGEALREDGIYWTCMFTTYYTEQIPAILRELNSEYDLDGIWIPSWPSSRQPRVCHCDVCNRLGDRGPANPAYYTRHMERTIEICRLWDSIGREKSPDNRYITNLNGGIDAVANVKTLADEAVWLNADHQGRRGDTPIWSCAQQGRVAQSVMKGRPTTICVGVNSVTTLSWRHVSKSPAEATLWMAQIVASGSKLWHTWLGGSDPQDQRWRDVIRRFYQWNARHDAHFANRRSLANLGVVFGQRTHAFWKSPGEGESNEALQGLYQALLEGRFLFDFIHEDDLSPATLGKFRAVLLPNVALLSDEQCRQLRAYVAAGGSLLATFETSLYDQDGNPRRQFGLADVFGIQRSGERVGPVGQSSSYHTHIERQHQILQGFDGTTLLPGSEFYTPVKISGDPALTILPAYPANPAEMAYARSEPTEPAIAIAEKGKSRLLYFPGDVDRACWRTGHTDLSLLLQNSVRWLMRGQMPVSVSGDGMAEIFAWQTEPGFAVHVINYNNPHMTRGWIRRYYPIGPQRVRLEIPSAARISRVQLLRTETDLQYQQNGSVVEFVIPKVEDYEVAALYVG